MTNHSSKKISGNQINIFQSIVDAIHRVTSLPVSIWIPDEKNKRITIAASIGLPVSYVRTALLDLSKSSVVGDAFKKNRIQKVMDIASEPRWTYKKQAQEMNWKSAICVPIRADSSVIGVISVYAYTERSISELVHILPDFAQQIALTLGADKQKEIRQRILDIGLILQTMTESPRDVLKEIVKGACELIGASSAVVYPYNVERGEFHDVANVAAYGLKKPLIVPEKPRIKGGMAADVIRKGEVVITNLKEQGPSSYARSSFIQKEGIKAFTGIALKETKNMLGVLYVNFNAPHVFTRQEKDTIQLFAHQASNALHNARLYQLARSQISALENLHEVGTALTSIPSTQKNLRSTLMRIAKTAQHVLDADLVDLYKYDQRRDWYDLPPVQVGKRHDESVPKIEIHKDDVIYKIVKSKEPKYFANAQQSKTLTTPFTVKRPDAPPKRFVEREGIKSTAAIPLIVGTEVVGVLFANYRISQSFSVEQKKLIELFGHQAAIAIWNARLFTSIQRRLQERLADIGTFKLIYEKMYSTNERELMSLIAETAVQLTGAKYGGLWQIDKSGTQLRLSGLAGEKHPTYDISILPIDSRSINGWVARSKKVYLCDDVLKDKLYREWYADTRSELAVPLLYKNKVIGTLNVESTAKNNFTSDHLELLQAMAAQAVTIIESARANDQLNLLVKINKTITSALDLDSVLNRVLEEVIKALGAHFGTVQIVDQTSGDLVIRASQGKTVGRQHQRIKIGQGVTGLVAKQSNPILVDDVKDPEAKAKFGYLEYFGDTRTELAVPIKVESRTIGVLNLEHPQLHAFDENDIQLLEAIANQIATAIRNSALNESLVNLGKATISGGRRQEEEVLELIHQQAGQIIDTKNMYIALYDDQTDTVRFGLAFVNGERINVATERAWQPRKAGQGRTEEIIRTKKSILHATKSEAKIWYAQPGHKDYLVKTPHTFHPTEFASYLGVPMTVGEKVLGIIAAYHPTQEYVYSGDDLTILQAMANHAAIALDNARLYYDIKDRLELLVDFGQKITSGVHLKENQILDLIHQQASQIIDTKNMYIALYDDQTDTVRFGLAFVNGERINVATERAWQPRKAGQGRTEEIIRTKKSILHATKSEAKIWYAQPGHEAKVREISSSWIGVPMTVGEKVLGIIAAYHPTQEYVYSGDDLTILQALANQTAVALNEAKAYAHRVENEKFEYLGHSADGIAHRINNTIGLLPLCASDIKSHLGTTDGFLDEQLSMIDRNARYILDLASELMKPFKSSEVGSFNINNLLEDAIRAVNIPQEVKIIPVFEKNIPKVHTTRLVVDVFVELISNAVTAMSESKIKRLEVSTHLLDDKSIEVSFTDSGHGIPKEEQAHLFELFYTTAEKKEASAGVSKGFGLWWIRTFLTWQGGEIAVDSEPSRGATFRVRLPLEPRK